MPELKEVNKVKRIYLQTEKDIIGGETTWCSDRINDDDEEYVRLSDLVAGGVVEVDGLKFVLVPREPTEAMQDAARDISDRYPYKPAPTNEKLGYMQTSLIYRAMIGAKP